VTNDTRTATTADAEAIASLVNRAFLVERFFVEGDRTNAAEIRELLASGSFLVIDAGGALAACVYVEVRGERGYFGLLAVEPSLQGKGLGRRLVDAAEAECRAAGCRAIDILVVDLRAELPPFYEKLGYSRTGTEPFTEPGRAKLPCEFIAMSKPLG
jgi:GNAT superfamily N-acetyltransferase